MKTPKYWQSNSLISKLLQPVGWIYGALTQLRLKIYQTPKASVPIVCVGNITAGGTGKTPVAISLAKILETVVMTVLKWITQIQVILAIYMLM